MSDVRLKTIRLEAGTRLLQIGSKCFFEAIGQYSNGTEKDITDEVKWISTNDRVGRFTDEGTLIGEAVGSTLIFVRLNEIRSDSVMIRVKPARKPVLKVSPLEIDLGNIERNKSKEFSVSIKNIGVGDLRWEIRSNTSWLVANQDLSRGAYALWLKTWTKNMPKPIDMNGDGKLDYFPPRIKPVSYKTWKRERKDLPDGLTGRETDNVTITAYTVDLQDGEYKGIIFVTSNGRRKEIKISMKVVSLEYITVTPVSIKVRAGQKRRFRAVGIWSDGSKTDLSVPLEGQWVVSNPSVGKFLYGKPVFVAKEAGETKIKKIRRDIVSDVAVVKVEEGISQPVLMVSSRQSITHHLNIVEEGISQPVLMVSPREIDLGTIGPGESSKGIFSLKNLGAGILSWSADMSSEWSSSDEKKLSGVVRNTTGYIRVYVRSLREAEEGLEKLEEDGYSSYPVQLKLEWDKDFVTCVKNLSAGRHREIIKLVSDGGMRRVFLRFQVAGVESAPSIKVEPLGIDSSIVKSGKQLVERIRLRNRGKDVLKWEARLQGNRKTFAGKPLKKGRYVSLLNKDVRGKEVYVAPVHLKSSVDISGVWSEDNGYPYSYGKDDILKYNFSGTGIALFVWKDFNGGYLIAYIDDKLMKKINCYSEKKERTEFLVAEDLEEGQHILTLISEEGHVVIEGVRVYGKNIMGGNQGWIEIFPDTGTTTSETDYVNIMINSQGLKPGYYSDNVLFSSNGGTAVVEITLRVLEGKASEILNIYRYVRGSDYLYTANPRLDGSVTKGYKREGVAFRLFSKGTPGTTEFFRWYNPSKRCHFYSCERSGGGKSLKGYVFEGSIGNVATIRLSGTKELYRWFNLSTGVHFYTTDSKGEGCSKRGYKYDGIAGYVR